jgi:hypothetical protein
MIRIEIEWWKLIEIAKESAENYEQLRKVQPDLPSVADALASKGWHTFTAMINDLVDLPDWALERATYKVVRPLKLMVEGSINAVALKEAMAVHQVHLPGNEMLRINEVHVEEDCCTDKLQERLKEGWRIVAVCPQPSRRPDYVLGRATLT